MLTARGWWLLFMIFLLLMFGMQASHPALVVLGLALLLWFAWEWFVFTLRLHFVLPKLYLERSVSDDRGPVKILWVGRIFQVHTRLRLPAPLRLPFVFGVEHLPFEAERIDGELAGQGPVSDQETVEIRYRIRCDKIGVARFEGVRVQLSDFQGFFYYATFVQLPGLHSVLPMVHDVDSLSSISKQRNQLRPPGIHRLRSGGSGSELLDLRDYMTGDPPKTIAWKISARRDRLITKVFETEVPIRCTLFVDVSSSVRVPALQGTALQRLIEIAGGVIRANVHSRDLTGLCSFDEQGIQYAPPDRRGSHLNRLLQMLADAAALPPTSSRADPEALIPLAYSFASEVYPELMRNEFNTVPFWLTGITRFPTYTRRSQATYRLMNSRRFWFFLFSLPTVGPILYGLILMLTASQRRLQRWRKRLAALLSVRYGLAPGGLAALLEDDDAFSLLVQRFFAEHHVPFRLPLYGLDGRYLFAAREKVPILAGALQRAIGRGRDNELFVLLVDLLEVDDELAALLSVVHVALSRHHQVVIVCPWPPGLPLPQADPTDVQQAPPPTFAGLLRRSTRRRYHNAFFRLRRTFGRLSVPVICAASDEAVPVILERINRLRTLRRTAR